MTDRKPGEWGVIDTNATARKSPDSDELLPRVHEVRPGKRYSLRSDVEVYMPEADARIFLKDAAFVVTDADGNPRKAITEEQLSRVMPQTRLAPNMVIADLNELTDAALKDRVGLTSAGADLPKDADRQTLIDFLSGVFQVGMPRAGGPSEDVLEGEDPRGEDPASLAARMLGGE